MVVVQANARRAPPHAVGRGVTALTLRPGRSPGGARDPQGHAPPEWGARASTSTTPTRQRGAFLLRASACTCRNAHMGASGADARERRGRADARAAVVAAGWWRGISEREEERGEPTQAEPPSVCHMRFVMLFVAPFAIECAHALRFVDRALEERRSAREKRSCVGSAATRQQHLTQTIRSWRELPVLLTPRTKSYSE